MNTQPGQPQAQGGATRDPRAPGVSGAGGLSSRQKAYGVLIALLFLVLGVVGYRWATNDALATLVKFTGQTERDKAAAMKEWFRAQTGDEFLDGDGARTSKDSTAHFKVGGGASLRLKPSSQLRFKRQHTGKKGGIGLQVEVGEADVRTDEGTLSLDSQFGPILIEANSSVTMRREGERMVLNVDLGTIEVGNEGRSVTAGQSVELELGGVVVDEPEGKDQAAEEPVEDEPEEPEESLDLGDGVTKFDLTVDAGATFVVHDPSPPSAVGFRTSGVCPNSGARLVAGGLKTEAKGKVGFALARGTYEYQVYCMDAPDKVAASGTVRILHDSGMRALPAFTPSANVAADGRKYTVMYQQRLPQVSVSWPSAPEAEAYTLTVGGRTINTSSPSYTFRSGSLRPGTHTLIFAAATDPPRQSRSTTVTVVYDTQAPAARVSDPPSGFAAGSQVKVAGQALPGWTVSLHGKELEVDGQRRFSTDFSAKGAVPIAFSHPTHGMHYYLRRPGSP